MVEYKYVYLRFKSKLIKILEFVHCKLLKVNG